MLMKIEGVLVNRLLTRPSASLSLRPSSPLDTSRSRAAQPFLEQRLVVEHAVEISDGGIQ